MKISKILLYILSTTLIYSCGVDRTYEFEEKTQEDKWIEDIMKEHYLWYDQMPTLKFNDYFAAPQDFLKKTLFKGNSKEKSDNFSYIEINDESLTTLHNISQGKSTYGFDFELIKDPTGTTAHIQARVLFVLPNSPAFEAGLKRGDWISKVGNARVTNDNYDYLMSGASQTVTLRDLTDNEGELSWTNEREITLPASRIVENDPFYFADTYHADGKVINYLVYNRFSTGPTDKSTETQYLDEMKQIFAKFKGEGATDFILDLRFNSGGYLSCGEALASMLAPTDALGKTFLTLKYNDKKEPGTVSYNLNKELSTYNLNLNKIYIITSSFTASTAEAVINALIPYMGSDNVITVGETTVGENVALEPFTKSDINFTIWPAVAYVLNADNSGDYANGISPTFAVNERDYYSPLLPIGDKDELLLKNTISIITSGNIITDSSNSTTTTEKSEYKSSISLRNRTGLKVK